MPTTRLVRPTAASSAAQHLVTLIYVDGGLFIAGSRLQPVVSQSTAEAEYYALGTASQEVMFVRNVLAKLGFSIPPTPVYEDNRACLLIATNEICASRAQHIEIKYHAVRDLVRRGLLQILPVSTTKQVADCLTKTSKGNYLPTAMRLPGPKLQTRSPHPWGSRPQQAPQEPPLDPPCPPASAARAAPPSPDVLTPGPKQKPGPTVMVLCPSQA
jgi:hypothetical protein